MSVPTASCRFGNLCRRCRTCGACCSPRWVRRRAWGAWRSTRAAPAAARGRGRRRRRRSCGGSCGGSGRNSPGSACGTASKVSLNSGLSASGSSNLIFDSSQASRLQFNSNLSRLVLHYKSEKLTKSTRLHASEKFGVSP